VERGDEVTRFYDPMLAKLIVHAPTRETAVARMHRALTELVVLGVDTSRDLHLRMMEDAEFREGRIDIEWLERRLESLLAWPVPEGLLRDAAVVAALLANRDRGAAGRPPAPASDSQSAWTRVGRAEGLR